MPYSSDSDLELIWNDPGALPLPLVNQAAEAERVIQTMLRRRGLTDAEIATLSTKTRVDLKVPSCHYVLKLAFGAMPGQAALELSEYHLKEFERTFNLVEVWASGTTTTPAGYVGSGHLALG